ncbi:hypothetical protein AVEN_187947-1 [Araneus ventricosus]|uniref:Uncharacterized protein n=1 Tax=Araneus ventricosus TaxID=182803 RepID=A0A4Y2E0U0_ARAVE|nr:hypothetical protein AVEN_187947-1 [Araneus ventricosus]
MKSASGILPYSSFLKSSDCKSNFLYNGKGNIRSRILPCFQQKNKRRNALSYTTEIQKETTDKAAADFVYFFITEGEAQKAYKNKPLESNEETHFLYEKIS